jgi:hypothetical protein
MKKFINCIYVLVFFALVSSLAFFPFGSGGNSPGGGDAIANLSVVSSIPQKVDSDIKTQILKRNEEFPISFAKDK